MKLFFIILMAAFSFTAHAEDSVTAQVKYLIVDGQKAFGVQWFAGAEMGVVNWGFEWANYDESVKLGFKLNTAKNITFVSPQLPADCKIKSFKGTLNWVENGSSPMSATFVGASCQQFMEALAKTPLEIKMNDVSHSIGGASVQTLILKTVELP